MSNILEVKNLSKKYHTLEGEIEAISNVSFNLKDKEFIAIVGSSGCGKSTLLSILSGLVSDYKGVIKSDKSIGYMLQTDCLLPWLTIRDNALLGLKIKNLLNEDYTLVVDNLLKKYDLWEFKDKYPSSLSGGMKQRVALIRTLALKPDILLLDEPFSALDYQTRLNVSNDVYHIIKNEGKSAIMVTHDLAEALSLASRIIILSKRPAHVKKIFEVNMDMEPLIRRRDKKFMDYYDVIWKELDNYES